VRKVDVQLKNHPYSIWIENGITGYLSEILSENNNGQKWILISQKTIFEKFGKLILKQLKDSKYFIEPILIQDGEAGKSFSSIKEIYNKLISFSCDRNSIILALGGGVVGDVAGFIAATFMRGIAYYQIPTTLLAMVDSSIGGKTGINLPQGKNLVGVIWQPKGVIIDPELLISLPQREFCSAFGEIIKYSVILDSKLFKILEKKIEDLLKIKSNKYLIDIIENCVKLKVDIVVADERENGQRKILNFGHTIGHALEKYYGFDKLRHGEAVAYGMLAAGQLSVEYASFSVEKLNKLKQIIIKLSLPKLKDLDPEQILKYIRNDKKTNLGKTIFVLLDDIGSTSFNEHITDKSIKNVLGLLL